MKSLKINENEEEEICSDSSVERMDDHKPLSLFMNRQQNNVINTGQKLASAFKSMLPRDMNENRGSYNGKLSHYN